MQNKENSNNQTSSKQEPITKLVNQMNSNPRLKNNVGSGKKKSKQDPELKFSRSPEERLKDRERAKQLEKNSKDQGYNFTITARDVRTLLLWIGADKMKQLRQNKSQGSLESELSGSTHPVTLK